MFIQTPDRQQEKPATSSEKTAQNGKVQMATQSSNGSNKSNGQPAPVAAPAAKPASGPGVDSNTLRDRINELMAENAQLKEKVGQVEFKLSQIRKLAG